MAVFAAVVVGLVDEEVVVVERVVEALRNLASDGLHNDVAAAAAAVAPPAASEAAAVAAVHCPSYPKRHKSKEPHQCSTDIVVVVVATAAAVADAAAQTHTARGAALAFAADSTKSHTVEVAAVAAAADEKLLVVAAPFLNVDHPLYPASLYRMARVLEP